MNFLMLKQLLQLVEGLSALAIKALVERASYLVSDYVRELIL